MTASDRRQHIAIHISAVIHLALIHSHVRSILTRVATCCACRNANGGTRRAHATQANFHTSSTHTPTIDTYKTRHVGSTASVTKLIARSRSHGFPLSLRLDGLRPAGHSSQLHKHTRHPLERPLVLDGARASVFGRAFCLPASLSLGCAGRLGWVIVSPAPTGAGANRPPLTGGQLTFGVLVDVLPPARARALASARARASAAASALVIAL